LYALAMLALIWLVLPRKPRTAVREQ